jgi:mRNA-degrading endonuclease RelE of RelBE toxin-antitoxin system
LREIRWTNAASKEILQLSEPLRSRVMAKVKLLEAFPTMGPAMDGSYEGFRQLLVRPYRVIYQFDEGADVVWIAYLRHGARQLTLRVVHDDDGD